jgi:hypothetical protein
MKQALVPQNRQAMECKCSFGRANRLPGARLGAPWQNAYVERLIGRKIGESQAVRESQA